MFNQQQQLTVIHSLTLSMFSPVAELLFWVRTDIKDSSEFIAKTDGRTIYYGNKFFELDKKESCFVVMHELFHCAFRHISRSEFLRSSTDHYLWNVAADLVINQSLLTLNWVKAPPFGIFLKDVPPEVASKFPADFTELSVEQVFDILKQNEEAVEPLLQTLAQSEMFDLFTGEGETLGTTLAANGDDKSDLSDELLTAELVKIIENIEAQIQGQGTGTASLQKLFKRIPPVEYKWKRVLSNFLVKSMTRTREANWCRPSTLTLAGITPLFLPNLKYRKDYERVVIAIDLSGSCWSSQVCSAFAAHVLKIQSQMNCEITVVTFDSVIKDVVVYETRNTRNFKEQLLNTQFHGGGGTVFSQLFEPVWIDHTGKRHAIAPKSMVILTDLDGIYPEKAPRFPVLWARPKGFGHRKVGDVPFGQVIEIDAIRSV